MEIYKIVAEHIELITTQPVLTRKCTAILTLSTLKSQYLIEINSTVIVMLYLTNGHEQQQVWEVSQIQTLLVRQKLLQISHLIKL